MQPPSQINGGFCSRGYESCRGHCGAYALVSIVAVAIIAASVLILLEVDPFNQVDPIVGYVLLAGGISLLLLETILASCCHKGAPSKPQSQDQALQGTETSETEKSDPRYTTPPPKPRRNHVGNSTGSGSAEGQGLSGAVTTPILSRKEKRGLCRHLPAMGCIIYKTATQTQVYFPDGRNEEYDPDNLTTKGKYKIEETVYTPYSKAQLEGIKRRTAEFQVEEQQSAERRASLSGGRTDGKRQVTSDE